MMRWFMPTEVAPLKKLRFIGHCRFTIEYTDTKRKIAMDIMFYMSNDGEKRMIEIEGGGPREKQEVMNGGLYRACVRWEKGGAFPSSFEPVDPDHLAKMLTKILADKMADS